MVGTRNNNAKGRRMATERQVEIAGQIIATVIKMREVGDLNIENCLHRDLLHLLDEFDITISNTKPCGA